MPALQNGMFLYFDRQGNLKEQINDSPLRQGNSGVNKIYVYWEKASEENIISLWSRYTRAELSGDITKPSSSTYYFDTTKVTGQIPFNDKRDLKFFKYYKDYEFYEITIPDTVLSVGDTTWLCSMWFAIDTDSDNTNNDITVDDNGHINSYNENAIQLFAMGGVAFYVIPLGFSIASDENINIAQWNYLMKKVGQFNNAFEELNTLENAFTILSNRVSTIEDSYVTLNTEQQIMAKKRFQDGIEMGNSIDMKGALGIRWMTNAPYKNILIGYGNNTKDYIVSLPNKDGTIAINEDLVTYGKSLSVTIDSDYVMTFVLKDANNNVLSTQTVDLPLESLITDGYYDSTTESIVLDLASGGTIVIPVSDLLSDIVTSSDLADALDDYYEKTETYSKTEIDTILDYYVEKEQGKGLSTNDFTTQYKNDLIHAYNYSHWHDNKAILDSISQQDITKWNTEYLPINTFKEIKSGKLEVWDNVGTSLLVENLTLSGEDFSTISNISFRRKPTTGNPQSTFGINTSESGIATRDKRFALSVYQYNITQTLPDDVFVVKSLQNKTTNTIELGHEDYDLWLGGNSVVLQTSNNTVNVDTLVSNLGTINTNMQTYAKTIELSIDNNYDLVAVIKDANGNIISQDDVDLPLESIIVSAQYYGTYTYDGTTYTKVIVVTLATTSVPTIIPVGDLVSGLVNTSDLTIALNDYYDKTDINTMLNAKADTSDITAINSDIDDLETNSAFNYDSVGNKYKAKGDIDLNNHDLDLTHSSLYIDFDYLINGNITLQDELTNLSDSINTKQDTLVGSGTGQNVKTINGNDIVGSGNILVQEVLQDAGANQNIKTINNTSLLGNGNIAVQEVLIGSGAGQNLKTIGGNNLLGSGDIGVIVPQTSFPQTITQTGNYAWDLLIKGVHDYSGIRFGRSGGVDYGLVGAGRINNVNMPVYVDMSNVIHQLAYQETVLTYAKSLEMSIDSDFDLVVTLKDANGNVLSQQDVDLPLESVVVGGSYDSVNEKIVLTLENGNTIDIPVSDLVSGLVSTTYLTTNYYNKTSIDTSLSNKANTSDLGDQVTMTFSNGVLTITPKS